MFSLRLDDTRRYSGGIGFDRKGAKPYVEIGSPNDVGDLYPELEVRADANQSVFISPNPARLLGYLRTVDGALRFYFDSDRSLELAEGVRGNVSRGIQENDLPFSHER